MAPETFDLESITLDEAIEVEAASGRDFRQLVKSRIGQRMIASYLLALRKHERDTSLPPPEWTGGRRILDASGSTSASLPDGASETPEA
jgi:hypothetical protein